MSQEGTTSLLDSANSEEDPPKEESPAEVKNNNYATGFCTTPESCNKRINEIVGIIFLCLLMYYLVTNFSAFIPYAKGIFKILKYFILYTLIFSTFFLFLHLLGYLFWWTMLFYWAVDRLVDPLKDPTTREWYYYFTDNVNWIIYGGATIYFFLWVIALIILLCLIILPAVSIIGFLVGYLFSLMGEAPCDKPDGTMLGKLVSGTMKGVSGVSSAFSKLPLPFKKSGVPGAPINPVPAIKPALAAATPAGAPANAAAAPAPAKSLLGRLGTASMFGKAAAPAPAPAAATGTTAPAPAAPVAATAAPAKSLFGSVSKLVPTSFIPKMSTGKAPADKATGKAA
jgi:hypothetical protein